MVATFAKTGRELASKKSTRAQIMDEKEDPERDRENRVVGKNLAHRGKTSQEAKEANKKYFPRPLRVHGNYFD